MQKKMYGILAAGVGIGVACSVCVVILGNSSLQKETVEKHDDDPLWVLSEEKVALADGDTIIASKEDVGYVFEIDGTKIAMDEPALPVIARLGMPLSYAETTECLYGDMDKTYQYDGFEISTYMMGDIDYIAAVFITDQSVKTPEGVTLEMTLEDMEKGYGMSYVKEGDICAYEKDGTGLEFLYDDDEIVYIQYLSSIYM